MAELEANFTLEEQPTINATLSLDVSGITEHDLLLHRDYPDQHPMTAITGLLDVLAAKQNVLIAGANIQINGNTISATDTTYVAGNGISIVGNVISNTQVSAVWGNITGSISAQTDLYNELQDLDGRITSDHDEITNISLTMQTYGDIVTHNTSEFATAAEGALAVSAVQPGDNISILLNDAGYITLSALNGYATQAWVQSRGYLTEISYGDVTTALGFTPYDATNPAGYITSSALTGYATQNWVTGQGYITGIDSSDVTTALGYTPYDSANPAGYITSAALPTLADLTTDEQMAAINSGATTTNIGQIATNTQAISDETTNRQNADYNLQQQIDAITSASDVTDIVGTYAQLQAYDTTNLPNNSIIKVLQDESRDNETTYYRWVITNGTGTWVLIGEEGPYYTKSEANNTFVPQSRTVNSKALSANISLTASDVGAATSAQGALADTAVQPGDLATVATSGSYTDLTNKPTIPAAQIQSDWTQTTTTAVDYIKNKPTLATVATSGSYNDLSNKPTIPAAQVNSDWNAASGVAQILNKPTIPTDTSDLTNGAGYITSSALSGYVLSSSLAAVATSGSYADLNNKPTIPTVNNPTITFTQGGTTKGTITLNQSSSQTIAFDAGGGGGGGNYVTTDTDQDITAIKTFIGDKCIKFKQSVSSNKLGFTCYSNTGAELGGLELRPNTVNGKPIITLMTKDLSTGYVGFRYWGGTRNILAPYPSSSGEYFITVGVTDGTNTVTTTDNGILNISSLLTPYALSSSLATVATSGAYSDLSGTPTIPTDTSDLTNGAGYITSSALSGYVLSSSLAAVATSGSYADLNNKPTIPTVNNPTITFTQGGTTKGTITLNQSSNQTIEFDAGGGGGSYTAGDGIDITNNVISVDGEQTSELTVDNTPTQNSSNLITSGGVYSVLGDIESAINTIRGV